MYEFIYEMKAEYEIEPGWYKLKWKPIKHNWPRHGNWNLGILRNHRIYKPAFRARTYRMDADNGWGRYWKSRAWELRVLWWDFAFWIKWDIQVMKEGPMDIELKDRKPIDVSHLLK